VAVCGRVLRCFFCVADVEIIKLHMCCSMLQCVTVCCGVLQFMAVRCSAWQCVAVCCSAFTVLQMSKSNICICVAVCCSVLQCVAVCCNLWQCVEVHGSVLQCVAVLLLCCRCRNRRAALCCIVLQCIVVCCNAVPVRGSFVVACGSVLHCAAVYFRVRQCSAVCCIVLYGVATISRLLKITRLFYRISSLFKGSFAKETYHFKKPTTRMGWLRLVSSLKL